MRKFISLLLVLALALTLLCGCSGKTNPESTAAAPAAATGDQAAAESTESSAEPVHLKWATWYVEGTPYYQGLIDAYTAEHPNVTIELVDLGNTDYNTVLLTQLSGGADNLDIMGIKDVAGYSNLINLGMLEPLSEYGKAHGLNPDDYSGTLEQLSVDNEYYMLPYVNSFWLLFYNKDLFDKAGVPYPTNDMTLDDYDALARQMTSGSGADKVYGCHYQTWKNTVGYFGILDGKHSIIDGNYDFLAPYYERVLAQQRDGICMDYATLKTSSIHYAGVFYNQQTAMIHMGNWFISMLYNTTESGENLATNWGIVRYPHPDGVEAGTTLSTITGIAVNSQSKNKEAACDFIHFVAGRGGAKVIAEFGQFPMIMTDEALEVITSRDLFPKDEASREALTFTKAYLEMPMTMDAADIETVLNECHDNIMTENVTVEEGIAEMNAGVQAILSK